MQNVKPKKALGQHFLVDLDIARRIAATLDPWHGLPVLEVGPGMGVLTRFLIEDGHDVTVAEIDSESVAYLKSNLPQLPQQRILECDFLRTDLAAIYPDGQKFCVIGNYPYNISSQIFFHVLEYKEQVVCCSGMLQREVAERLAAPPGTKARGILSVLLQAWYDVEYLFTVSEHVFNPPPKVKSDEKLFKTGVKTTFGQRRKTIRNSFRSLIPPAATLPDHPLLAMRPEQLSVGQFIELTNLVSNLRAS